VSSALYTALRAADADAPPALGVFDRLVAGEAPWPDFYEHSIRFGPAPDDLSPYRLTDYFDVHRHGPSLARVAGERFVALCAELGLSVPAPLAAFVGDDVPACPEALQAVVGIDVPVVSRRASAPRAKYYVVFRGAAGACVTRLLERLAIHRPDRADPAKVYILGVDVTASGVDDVKLYFHLDPARARRSLARVRASVGELLAASRDVVFQQCLRRPERRQIYLHASRGDVVGPWLARQGYAAPLRYAASLEAAGCRIEPWIVSLPYDEDGGVGIASGTAYFHVAPRGILQPR
jgi:hypothetical protein